MPHRMFTKKRIFLYNNIDVRKSTQIVTFIWKLTEPRIAFASQGATNYKKARNSIGTLHGWVFSQSEGTVSQKYTNTCIYGTYNNAYILSYLKEFRTQCTRTKNWAVATTVKIRKIFYFSRKLPSCVISLITERGSALSSD